MKLGYLVSRYPAVSQTFVLAEVLALRRQGFDIDTFAIRRSPPEEVLSEADREADRTTYAVLPARPWRVLRAHAHAIGRSPSAYLATLAYALRLGGLDLRAVVWQAFYFAEAMIVWDECERRGIRHLHVHFPNVASDVAMLAARFGGAGWSFSLTLHGPTELYDVQGHRLVEKIRRARFAICISYYMRSQLMHFVDRDDWHKLHVLRCGIDIERFVQPPTGRRAADVGVRILAVGRLDVRKGHVLLVEAFARAGVDGELTIVGEGPERAALERRASELGVADCVRLPGAVGQDEIPEYFRGADVFCMPSFAEGVPIALMEAMASELPVVAPRLMGIPELVEDGVSGRLITPASVEELTSALRELCSDAEKRQEFGAAGRKRVAAEFELHETVRRVGDLMRTVEAA